MTDEYIRKQDVVDYCKALMNAELVQHTNDWGYGKERYNQTEVILEFIENRQPADVAPVAHSRWIKTADGAECEKCGREAVYQIIDDHWQYEPFCPHCGAKMDGGKNT